MKKLGIWKYIFGIIGLVVITVWTAVGTTPEERLHLIACEVGQGDAILAVYGKVQILIDGGPNDGVLECLSRYMPFWDRDIELVLMTHPDKDHYGGLIDVFEKYRINTLLVSAINSSSQDYQVLESMVGGSVTKVVVATDRTDVRLGKIHLDILHPSEEFLSANTTKITSPGDGAVLGVYASDKNENDFSVVAILRLGDFDALLTGDIEKETSDLIADKLLSKNLQKTIEYIKVPHHGSKNGLTEKLLDAVKPEIAVIPVGKNSYGHPHKEILDMLSAFGLRILRTDQLGDIEVITDGEKYWIQN